MDEPRRIEQRDVEEPLKSYRTILQQEILQAEQEIRRPGLGLFVSGLLAGFGVGMSLFLMAAVRTLSADVLPEAVAVLLMANAYTVGFIIVILGRTDLFTEYTTIAILPVLMGRASVAALGRLWGRSPWRVRPSLPGAQLGAVAIATPPGCGLRRGF